MSHNIQTWSHEDSTQTAVPRPWTGIVTTTGPIWGHITFLVKCEAPTRREALILLQDQLYKDDTLVAAVFGDHSDVILDTEIDHD